MSRVISTLPMALVAALAVIAAGSPTPSSHAHVSVRQEKPIITQKGTSASDGTTVLVKTTKQNGCTLVETTVTHPNGAQRYHYKYNCEYVPRKPAPIHFSGHQARPIVTQKGTSASDGTTVLVKTTKQGGCTLVETTVTYPSGAQKYEYTYNCKLQTTQLPSFTVHQAHPIVTQKSARTADGATALTKTTKQGGCTLVETTITSPTGARTYRYTYNCQNRPIHLPVFPNPREHSIMTAKGARTAEGATVIVKTTKQGHCTLVETTNTSPAGLREYHHELTCIRA